MRIALGVEYDGTRFRGWQSQASGVRCVQTELEAALTRVADQSIQTICAGRTDAGVHATAQVVHFDTTAERPDHGWVLGCNSNVPRDLGVRWMRSVSDDFHARFSATERHYKYLIQDDRVRPTLLRHRVTWTRKRLSVERMAKGGRHLLGEHDFSSFRSSECQAHSPIRTVDQLTIRRAGQFVVMDVQANAFLHHMVRNIAGVLMAVGSGDCSTQWPADVLKARDRRAGGVTAPAQGLYLVGVRYPECHDLPESGGDLLLLG
jgi:tRNA pseudouridine38-40 synthase